MDEHETRELERIRDENEWLDPGAEALDLARRAEAELKGSVPDGSLRVLLPSNADPLAPQEPSRRARFARRLTELAGRPVSGPPPAPDAPTGRETLVASVCTACRGSCCRAGGDHAYLTEETILRAREAHPDWTPAALVDAYLQRLPAESVEDSCIYHSAAGCGLPRELRSSTCNRHLCGKLKNLLDGLPAGAPPPILAVMFDDRKWTRTVLIDERGPTILGGR